MIRIENFDNIRESGITYGGRSGSKKGIILNGERWFLKYPKSTRSMKEVDISYTTSPISEYLGSQIYSMLGFNTHETRLGISDGKVVVACKDFLNNNESIIDYNSIKNDYNKNVEKKLEKLSSSSNDAFKTDINEIIIIMDNNNYFKRMKELRDRYWDMFIVDALINNNDRNDNNWGLIINNETLDLRLCPIYDNGASFYNKSSQEKACLILKDDYKMKQMIYDSCVSSFMMNGKIINPLKYIEGMKNKDCNKALIKIFPKIDLNMIHNLFYDIPSMYNGLAILSEEQKELYFKSIKYKYDNVLKPIYNILCNKNK